MTDNGEKNRTDSFAADSFATDSFVNYEAAEEQTDKAADGGTATCPACDASEGQTDAAEAATDGATLDGATADGATADGATTGGATDESKAGYQGDASTPGTPGTAAQAQTGKAGTPRNRGTASGGTIAGAEIYRSGGNYSNGLGITAVICAALKLTILPFIPGLGIFAIIASGVQASRKRAFDWWSAIGLGLGIASVLVTISMIITFIVLAANAIAAGGMI